MLSLGDVEAATDRVAETARHTPLRYSHTLSSMTGAEVHLKYENLQRTGAFKIRGATNRIATLSPEEQEAGVVTASAGNHAQGVALAASRMGVDATIVMPETAAIAKVQATQAYGGKVVLHGHDYDAAAERAHEIERDEGRTYVHAFDDPAVMAGQGTIGLEIIEDCPDVDTVVVPVGGGGLIAGIATAVTESAPDTRIVGVEADGAARAGTSLRRGEIVTRDGVDTVADGIATRRVGDRPFAVMEERVDRVVSVSDSDIATAMVTLLERTKTVTEGAGAVGAAALLSNALDLGPEETVVVVLSGGNVDLNVLTTVIVRGLVETGRYLRIRLVLEDRPGALEDLVDVFTEHRANIFAIQHDRTSREIGMSDAEVEIDLETRGPEHVAALLDALEGAGYQVEILE